MGKLKMIRQGVLAIMMLVSVLAGTSAQGANLLTNGDAAGGLSGWVDPDGAWSVETARWDRAGKMFWPSRKRTAGTRIYQDVAVGFFVGGTATLSSYAHGYGLDKDRALLRLEFLNSGGSVIDSCESDFVSGERDKDAWRQISVSRVVPAGAVTARVSLVGINGHNATSDCDSYFADVVFAVRGGSASGGPAPTVGMTTAAGMTTVPGVSLICTLEPGDSVKLALPGETSVVWSSSDSSVATVSKKGKIKAVNEGTAVITAVSPSMAMRIQVEVEE